MNRIFLQVLHFIDLWHKHFSQSPQLEGKQYGDVLRTALQTGDSSSLPSFGDAALAFDCLLQVECYHL